MITRRIALFAVAAAFALTAVPATFAAKGGGGGGGGGGSTGSGSTVSLVLVNSTDGLPHHGQLVTFKVTTTATTRPYVTLKCYQNGTWVYTDTRGMFPEYLWSQNFTLSSSMWTVGAADCTARAYSTKDGTRTTTLATLDFHVWA